MKSKMFKYIIYILFILMLSACGNDTEENNTNLYQILNNPNRQLKKFDFDPNSKLLSRIKEIPNFLLKELKSMDNKYDYANYFLNKKELNEIEDCIRSLTPVLREVMYEKVVSIYFVENFVGGYFSNWIVDNNKNLFFFIVINPDTIKYNISEWLTLRENTCFIKDDIDIKIDIKIDINLGEEYNAIVFVLFHALTYITDTVKSLTPYTDQCLRQIFDKGLQSTEFTKDVWKNKVTPIKQFDFSQRRKISFFNISDNFKTYKKDKEAKINISDSIELYKQFSMTPFVSLIGSKNWGYDLSEYLALYHLNKKCNQPYIINIFNKDKLVFSYEPLNSDLVLERANIIEKIFYK